MHGKALPRPAQKAASLTLALLFVCFCSVPPGWCPDTEGQSVVEVKKVTLWTLAFAFGRAV